MTDAAAPGGAVLEVLDPAFLATIQDAGRPGLGAEGVSRGGAADTWSLAVANALLGNPDGAAALELTLAGPRLRALDTLTVGIAGALAATVVETGERLVPGGSATIRAGSTLAFEPAQDGARGYLAVPGGIDVPVVLGSRSTALGAGFGGVDGRALRAGDRLAALARRGARTPPPARWPGPSSPVAGPVRVLPGPHTVAVSGALAALLDAAWTVAAASDRTGLRLVGPALEGGAGEHASHGVVAGAVQLPPDGTPIILLADHQPTGGYPVVAVVITADLPRLGQLVAGAAVAFTLVTPGEARAALVAGRRAFEDAVAHMREASGWDELWHGAGG